MLLNSNTHRFSPNFILQTSLIVFTYICRTEFLLNMLNLFEVLTHAFRHFFNRLFWTFHTILSKMTLNFRFDKFMKKKLSEEAICDVDVNFIILHRRAESRGSLYQLVAQLLRGSVGENRDSHSAWSSSVSIAGSHYSPKAHG